MKKEYCEHCKKQTEYTTKKRNESLYIKLTQKTIKYKHEFALCKECNNEMYIKELNVRNVNERLKNYNK